MISGTISHYQILRKLGEGGMGEVYLAEDTRLGRQVALKFLPASFQYDSDRRSRFLKEARAASALRSPYVAAIYDIGEHEGSQYIAMEYVEGDLLSQRLAHDHFPVRDALEIVSQVAEALDEAHQMGIVHRDIKSSNLILTGRGFVKVLDFGLAKMIQHSGETSEDDHDRTLLFGKETAPGIVLGTAAYMSPEQARGLSVDGRSDLFSLGVVLYELVTGRKPFSGETISDLLVAILDREPVPISHHSAAIPPQLEWIINKALRKNRDERYQSAKDLCIDIKSLKTALDLESSLERTRAVDRSSGAIAPQTVSLDAQTVKLSDPTAPSTPLAPPTRKRRSRKVINSIAILPLLNASTDSSMEYLSDGITETIINNLSRLPKLRVMARSTAFRYKGRDVDPVQVGGELGVRAVLTGRVQKINGNLIIGAELVDVDDGSQLWGEQYNRTISDIFKLQEEISNEILVTLRPKLGGKAKKVSFTCCTESTEAYELYLKGRFNWNKWTYESFLKAIEFFEQAIEKDPHFALAFAGLSDAYGALWYFNLLPPTETLPKAETYALKALALDNSLAEAHLSLANMELFYKWDWEAADREYRRALELNPNFAGAYHMLTFYYISLGRFDEAMASARRAAEFDPLSPAVHSSISGVLLHSRKYEEAIANLERIIEFEPNFLLSYEWLASIYELAGRGDEAVHLRRRVRPFWIPNEEISDLLFQTYQESGLEGYWRKWLDIATAPNQTTIFSKFHIAVIYGFLGEKDSAFEWLEKACDDRSAFMVYLKVDPKLDPLRSDPRFDQMVRRVGIPSS